MANKREYAIPIYTFQNIEIDFEKLYNLIKEDDKLLTGLEVHWEFGDNMKYWLTALGIDTKDFDEDDPIFDDIFNDFFDWLNENGYVEEYEN